VISEEKN